MKNKCLISLVRDYQSNINSHGEIISRNVNNMLDIMYYSSLMRNIADVKKVRSNNITIIKSL